MHPRTLRPGENGVIMIHPPLVSRALLVLLACATLLSGCAVTRSLFRDRAAEERAAALLQVQLSVMRFADEYTAWITERVGMFQQSSAPGSPYAERCRSAVAKMAEDEGVTTDVRPVVRAAIDSIESDRPPLRYPVASRLQLALVGLRHVLPQRLYEKLVMDHYGVD